MAVLSRSVETKKIYLQETKNETTKQTPNH